MQVQRVADRRRLLAFLERDRLWAAYAIGDLEPGLFEHCEWGMAVEGGVDAALCLCFRGLEPPALFTMGVPAGIEAILRSGDWPSQVLILSQREHLPALETRYTLRGCETMLRMFVSRDGFCPATGAALPLDVSHLDELQALYRHGGGDAFAPYQLADGVYRGVRVDGELVAAAGTHLVAPTYGIAAIGNVFTQPKHRNRGYAQVCTSGVVEELFRRGIRDVVLNVAASNRPAVTAYTKLGFRVYCEYVEGEGIGASIPNLQSLIFQ